MTNDGVAGAIYLGSCDSALGLALRFALISAQNPVWSKNSCGITVVLQYAADALPTAYSASGFLVANFLWREQEDVTFPLVVSLPLKMINEVGERASQ